MGCSQKEPVELHLGLLLRHQDVQDQVLKPKSGHQAELLERAGNREKAIERVRPIHLRLTTTPAR